MKVYEFVSWPLLFFGRLAFFNRTLFTKRFQCKTTKITWEISIILISYASNTLLCEIHVTSFLNKCINQQLQTNLIVWVAILAGKTLSLELAHQAYCRLSLSLSLSLSLWSKIIYYSRHNKETASRSISSILINYAHLPLDFQTSCNTVIKVWLISL